VDVPGGAPYNEKIHTLGEATRVPLELKTTINLPKTAFPMKANLPQNEPKMLARWEEARIYERIREARKGSPTYILHDGPPYTSGPIHMGTALNKCLKDFIVKSKTMAGFDAPYVPGWIVTGCRLKSRWIRSWAARSCRCGRSMCGPNAASMRRSFWICNGSSSSALESLGDLIVRTRR